MKKIVSFTLVGIMLILTLFVASCGGDAKVEFKVNFVVDGEIYSTISTSGEEVIAIPQNPSKDGYTFDGWFWDEGQWQRPFTANSLLNEPLSSDMSVYAKWTEINVEPEQPSTDIISSVLEVNGEIATATVSNATATFSFLNDIKVADGASYILANDIGCQNVIASKTVALEEGDNTYYLLVTNDTAQKLYTVTIRRHPIYTVEFNTNGGTSVETLYIEEGNIVEMQETSKTGYTFVGWTLNNEAVSFPYTIKENVIFDAKFTIISYSIEYHLNGGANNESNVNSYTVEDLVTFGAPTRDYYTFNGWYDNENFEGSNVTEISVGNIGNKTFYAKWTPVQYEIKYELNGGINNEGNVLTYNVEQEITLSNPTRDYYTFDGWYDNKAFDGSVVEKIEKGSNGNKVFYAKWTPVQYEIKYELNGGINNESNVSTYNVEQEIILNNPTRDYYRFDGWFETENFSGSPVTKINQGTIENKTLYAKWTPIQYEIKYELNNGTNNESNVFTYNTEQEISLNNPTRDGYVFLGWFTNENFEGFAIEKIPLNSGENKKFYAKWQACENKLVFDGNGSTSGSMIDMIVDTDETKNLSNNTFEKVGYTFKGWSTTADGIVEYLDGADYIMGTNSTYTLYAVWEITKYSITYETNGGAHENPAIFTIEDLPLTLSPSMHNRDFLGWYADADCTEKVEQINSLEDTVLYAKWGSFMYKEYSTYVSIIGFDGEETEVVIPSTFNSKPVTKIEKSVFENCANIIIITISENIENIGANAFKNCTSLSQIKFNAKATNDVNYSTNAFDNAGTNTAGITLEIGKNVTRIPAYLFTTSGYGDSCSPNITSVIFEEGSVCQSIGKGAFRNCYNLISVEMPNCITNIGEGAFAYCTGLTKINIPNSITKINYTTFFCCINLTSITITQNVVSIDENAFGCCSKIVEIYNLSNIEIGTDYGSLGYYAKVIHTSLDEKSILETVGNYIFMTWQGEYYLIGYAGNESELTLPNNYKENNYSIYNYAFSERYNLTSITIPEGVKRIESCAFQECTNLKNIVIPSSITSISTNGTFDNCVSLTSIIVDENNNHYKSIDGNLYSKDGKTLVRYTAGKTDTSFIIPEGVTTIGCEAFGDCSSLTSVTIPNSVKSIKNNAFNDCTNLSSIVIPSSVTSMEWMVFTDCNNLTIYCEAETQPAGWYSDWNYSNCPVVWGHKEN